MDIGIKSEYQTLIDKANKVKKEEAKQAIKKIKELIAIYNIRPEQLGFKDYEKTSRRSGRLYRDPETGLTWTGYGRPPRWIENEPDREKFRVTDQPKESSK